MSEPMSQEEYIAMQAEIQRRYIEHVAKVLTPLLERLNPQADPKRRMEDLRDSFAAAALSGLCAAHKEGEWTGNCKQAAQEAYQLADDMLEARCVNAASMHPTTKEQQ